MSEQWLEARIREDHSPTELYKWLQNGHWPDHAHHFGDEPWWPKKWVVRLRGVDEAYVAECPAVDHVVEFDPSQDEKLYGQNWEFVQQFFEASSALAGMGDKWDARLIHCFMNARGRSTRQEARWALRFAWDRLTVGLRWKLYLRRRWERDTGPPVKK